MTLGMFFDVFLLISMHILLVQFFPQVVQKQTLCEMAKWPVI